MGVSSALDSARSGLSAASLAIETTSNNVANAATEGYSRQSVDLANNDPVRISGVQLGTGVVAESIDRASDRFLTSQIVEEAGSASSAETLRDVLVLAESWLADSEVEGLTSRLQGVFDSMQAATADPGDATYRSSVANAADSFATSFQRTATALSDLIKDVEDKLDTMVEGTNSLLEQVAGLNQRIVASDGAADLLDQRDRLLAEIAEVIGTTARINTDGSATVMLGGHALVSGVESRSLEVGEDDDGDLVVTMTAGNAGINVGDELGGSVGGNVRGVEDIEDYLERLDDLAEELADAFNDVHAAGYDRDGNAGADFFEVTASDGHSAMGFTFNASLLDDPTLLAFAADSSANIGDGGNLEDLLALETSDVFVDDSTTAEKALLSLLSDVGADVVAATTDADHASAILADLQGLRDAIAGVDLDEEAINLIKFQAAYQAAAKVIRATDTMLQNLMDIV